MFEKIKEQKRLEKERKIQEMIKEKERIHNLSEKELLVEILMELKSIDNKCDDIADKIVIWSSN